MIKLGNFFFHYRNGLFPLAYALLFVPSPPLLNDYRAAAIAGLLIAATGQLIRAVTVGLDYIVRGGRDRQVYADRLVVRGLFAHCRNPLYVGNYLLLLGVGLASNSLLFFCVAIPFFSLVYWAIIAAEENFLRNKFGSEFDDYCKRVNRLLPRLTGLPETFSSMRFNWRRLITAEYGSAYIWMAAIILVQFKNLWLRGQIQNSQFLVLLLCLLLGMVTVAYAIARYLKKSGALQTNAPATS
ncbi:MAG TPA: isoprenylcysteine carboxylmethyltransferase family protein [Verrucomicrobiae bacterium]|nr:isoprenylcysteine carboxylmethyltransferase family protein [Verrucomicrobiae bacterium]